MTQSRHPNQSIHVPSPNLSVTPLTYQVNVNNMAVIGGVSVDALARQYGTPLYIVDGSTFRAMASAYRDTMREVYPGGSTVLYASKANMNLSMVKLAQQEQLGVEVNSGGELYTALEAGFPPERIYFNGNNKSLEEVTMALHHGLAAITVDNAQELHLIHQVASQKQTTAKILLRVVPGIECHTHDYIKTGHIDSKFGFDLSMLAPTLDFITSQYQDTIQVLGLHAHIGSQIFESKPYEDLVEIMLNVYYNVREAYNGLTFTHLNLGGGMGIAYTDSDDPLNIAPTLERIARKLEAYAQHLDYPLPHVILEPGRSLIATAGATLYTVGHIKVTPTGKKYIAIDGGMGDNIRPALYQAAYTAVIGNKARAMNEETVTVAGKYCESGDILIQKVTLPRVDINDLLLVFGTGAYNYSMASNYNRVPRPAMVLVEGSQSYLMVRRESYQDLIANDLIPEILQDKNESLNGHKSDRPTRTSMSRKADAPKAALPKADFTSENMPIETPASQGNEGKDISVSLPFDGQPLEPSNGAASNESTSRHSPAVKKSSNADTATGNVPPHSPHQGAVTQKTGLKSGKASIYYGEQTTSIETSAEASYESPAEEIAPRTPKSQPLVDYPSADDTPAKETQTRGVPSHTAAAAKARLKDVLVDDMVDFYERTGELPQQFTEDATKTSGKDAPRIVNNASGYGGSYTSSGANSYGSKKSAFPGTGKTPSGQSPKWPWQK